MTLTNIEITMNLMFINKLGKNVIINNASIMPCTGDKIDVFDIIPIPMVDDILLYPSKNMLKRNGIDIHIDAIITVGYKDGWEGF